MSARRLTLRHCSAHRFTRRLLTLGLGCVGWLGVVALAAAEEGTNFRFHTAEGPASASGIYDSAPDEEPIWRIEWGQPATAIGPVAQPLSMASMPPSVSQSSVTARIVPGPVVANVSLDMSQPVNQTSLSMIVPPPDESNVSPVLPPSVVTTYQAELPSILVARRMQVDSQSPSNRPPAGSPPTMGWQAKPYDMMGVAIELPQGQMPFDYAAEQMAEELPGPPLTSTERGWAIMDYDWVATAFCHRPLYFEEPNLERYGYGCAWCLQPAASAAHFFGRVPALPYMMAADCPRECVYTLGHYRPGSPNPWRRISLPKRLRAAAAEGGVVAGLIFLIP